MTVLFVLLSAASAVVGLFISLICQLGRGLGLISTAFGEVICSAGTAAPIISILGVIIGIFCMRRRAVKRAMVLSLLGVIYSVVIMIGLGIDDIAPHVMPDRGIDWQTEELCSEGWISPHFI